MATLSSPTHFSKQQLSQQVQEDLEAGYVIPGILLAIMLFGFLSMVFSVWLAL